MKTNEFQSVSFEDIIFDGRNKAYGAYDIRKHYDVHLKTALTVAISLFLLLMFSPRIVDHFLPEQLNPIIPKVPDPDVPVNILEDVVLPKPPQPIQTTPPPAPDIATITYFTPRMVDRIVNHAPIPTNQDILSSDAQLDTKARDGGTGNIIPNQKPAEEPIFDDGKPQIFVENMPEFTGGDVALSKFIASHVKYPEYGIEYHLEGIVWVQFTVGKDGKVFDPKIIKSVRGGFDEEALRVIKMMPAWKPGRQNGREVPVYIKLPIKFTLKD